MQAYVTSKSWKDGYGAGEPRVAAANLTRMESGIYTATQGMTNVETKVAALADEMPPHARGVGGNIANREDGTSGFRELTAAPVGRNDSTSAFTDRGGECNNMPPYIGFTFSIKAAR